jgi:hypothetical protein
MAVPGLASFLAFLSRPQTPGSPRWGRLASRRAFWTLPLPSPTYFSHFASLPPGLRPGPAVASPTSPTDLRYSWPAAVGQGTGVW